MFLDSMRMYSSVHILRRTLVQGICSNVTNCDHTTAVTTSRICDEFRFDGYLSEG